MKSFHRVRRTLIKRALAAAAAWSLGHAERSLAAGTTPRPAPAIDIDALFTPFAIGRFQTKNRFVMAPMSIGGCRDGAPKASLSDHYELRARGGAGLLITGGTIVDHPLGAADAEVGRMTEQSQEGWRRVVDKVHAHEAGIFCQLWHQGPQTRPGIGPRAIVEYGRTVIAKASPSDLAAVVQSFARSARLAREAGFDGVEIHGAHGYLLDSYLRAFGTRAAATDEVTPATFVYLVVKAVRASVGTRFPIGFRFSRWSIAGGSGRYLADPASLERVLLPLKEAGVDVFHASRGYGPFWTPEYADSPLSLAGWCRRISDLPTITVGHVGLDPQQFFGSQAGSLSMLMEQWRGHQFDLVAVGRALLKNPDWVAMLQRREYDALSAASAAD